MMGCIHHMVIESPDGRELLHGYCKKCGYEREYAATDPKAAGHWERRFTAADDEPLLWLIEDDNE